MAVQKKLLQLKVIFDTNVIFNGSTSDLLTREITELIDKYSNPADISISWHIPETVLNERCFQMRKKGVELLPSLEKLEKLLGHNLGITTDIIETRIDEAITKSIKKYKLKTESIIIDSVDWKDIINCAVFRRPPFEDSGKEKGFRDALILESVMQIIQNSPISPSVCRIFFITNDTLLLDAFNTKAASSKNVRALRTIDELESQINILDSQIRETLISSISQQANDLFFNAQNKDTLYYKGNVSKIINSKFSKELAEIPTNADKREIVQWWISNPGFVKKSKQRIFWKTTITLDSKGIKITHTYSHFEPLRKSIGLSSGLSAGLGSIPEGIWKGEIGSISGLTNINSGYGIPDTNVNLATGYNQYLIREPFQPSEEIVSTGKTKFEVIWSVTLTTKKILKMPKVESVNFVETIWT